MRSVTVYISAGGRGTRLNSVVQPDVQRGVTKALLRPQAAGLTLIDYQIQALLPLGCARIVVGVGDHHHLADYIEHNYTDSGQVTPVRAATQLGNGGDLLQALQEYPELFAEYTLVVNADTFLALPVRQMVAAHDSRERDLTIALTGIRGVPNEDAFWMASDHLILHNSEQDQNVSTAAAVQIHAAYRASSAGATLLTTAFLKRNPWRPIDGPLSFYREIVGAAVIGRRAYAFHNGQRPFVDVGTVSTWRQIVADPSLIESWLNYVDP